MPKGRPSDFHEGAAWLERLFDLRSKFFDGLHDGGSSKSDSEPHIFSFAIRVSGDRDSDQIALPIDHRTATVTIPKISPKIQFERNKLCESERNLEIQLFPPDLGGLVDHSFVKGRISETHQRSGDRGVRGGDFKI